MATATDGLNQPRRRTSAVSDRPMMDVWPSRSLVLFRVPSHDTQHADAPGAAAETGRGLTDLAASAAR
jgi:hypothetical protein